MGRRNALGGERVLRRAVKRSASEWWLTPVSNSSDCRRDEKKAPQSCGKERETTTEQDAGERASTQQEEARALLLILILWLYRVIKTPFCLARHPWLPRLPSLDLRTSTYIIIIMCLHTCSDVWISDTHFSLSLSLSLSLCLSLLCVN